MRRAGRISVIDPAGDMEWMRTRLSCADSSFPLLSHDVALTVIADLGAEMADICVFQGYQHTTPAEVLSNPAAAYSRVAERLERHHLGVADVFLMVGADFEELAPNSPDEAVRGRSREYFEACLDFADRLETPNMTILP